MRKQMEESAAAEGARRATGAAAGRGRGERCSARRSTAWLVLPSSTVGKYGLSYDHACTYRRF